jgi:hypothetical protein
MNGFTPRLANEVHSEAASERPDLCNVGLEMHRKTQSRPELPKEQRSIIISACPDTISAARNKTPKVDVFAHASNPVQYEIIPGYSKSQQN